MEGSLVHALGLAWGDVISFGESSNGITLNVDILISNSDTAVSPHRNTGHLGATQDVGIRAGMPAN